jgi:hypothetical protein
VRETEGQRLYRLVRGDGGARVPLKVLAYQIGCSEQRVGQILAGSPPSLDLAARIFAVHGIGAHLWCTPAMKVALSKEASPNADDEAKVA